MVVNIKSARLLSPKNTLQTQLKVAALDTQAVIESTNNARIPRLEYNQFFQSPWCCDAGVEDQYRAMMESIFNLEMDDVCCTLLSLVAMFDTSGMYNSYTYAYIFLASYLLTFTYIKCTFSSNKIVQKISFSLCF